MVIRVVSAGMLTAILLPALWARPTAQTGAGGTESAVMATEGVRAMTPFEQFTDKLKLDSKTQVPAVREIFLAAVKDSGPVGVEMLQLRQKLLNVEMSANDAEIKAVQESYSAAAEKMAGIEAATLAKVYATLKPNQQSNAAQAFVVMAGIFQPSAPGGGGGSGARGGRGGGRQ